MNTPILCMVALLSAAPAASPDFEVATNDALTPVTVFRAQSPYDRPLLDPAWDYEPIFGPDTGASFTSPVYLSSPPIMAAAPGSPYGAYPAYGGPSAYGGYPTPSYTGYAPMQDGGYMMPPISVPSSYGPATPAPVTPTPMAAPAPMMMTPSPYTAPYMEGGPFYDPTTGTSSLFDPTIVGDGGPLTSFGANGPQPYRYGWKPSVSLGYLPNVSTHGALGDFGVFEVDAALQYTAPMSPSPKIFTYTQEFSYRGWDGPTSTPGLATELPGDVYHFGFNMAMTTPQVGPWTIRLVMDPSINSDFEDNLTSRAWNIDGHGMVFFRPDPYWTYVVGAGYWDRVNDKVIPYAGIIWTPDDRWEWRLVFPDPRISYFMGNEWGLGCWMYVRAEYHIEAYEIKMQSTGTREQVEIEDWRALIGIRKDNGWAGMFAEAGWVFGRNVAFHNGTPGFDPTTGFITRFGIHF